MWKKKTFVWKGSSDGVHKTLADLEVPQTKRTLSKRDARRLIRKNMKLALTVFALHYAQLLSPPPPAPLRGRRRSVETI